MCDHDENLCDIIDQDYDQNGTKLTSQHLDENLQFCCICEQHSRARYLWTFKAILLLAIYGHVLNFGRTFGPDFGQTLAGLWPDFFVGLFCRHFCRTALESIYKEQEHICFAIFCLLASQSEKVAFARYIFCPNVWVISPCKSKFSRLMNTS